MRLLATRTESTLRRTGGILANIDTAGMMIFQEASSAMEVVARRQRIEKDRGDTSGDEERGVLRVFICVVDRQKFL